MARYRVLVVNHAVEMGGAEKVLLGLLDSLDRDVFEPALACPSEGPLVEEARSLGVEVHIGFPSRRLLKVKRQSLGRDRLSILAYPFDLAFSVARLVRLIRRGRFDLVVTNSAKADIYGSIAGWASGRPVAWRLHDIVDAEAFNRLNVFLLKFCASRFATRVLAVSDAVADAVAAIGVPRSKLVTIYNGIDIEAAAASTADRAAVRSELGIPLDAPVAGMVGRLVDWKGMDYFIRAAASAAESLPGARFLLVGDTLYGEPEYVDTLKALCRELGFEERVIFTGFRKDIPQIMIALDVLVYASILPEPFGLGLIEAMANRRPVVGTNSGGIPEIVTDGVTGRLVPPCDSEAIARALIEILSDREKARSMGEAGLARAREQFDEAKATRDIEDEFLDMLCAQR